MTMRLKGPQTRQYHPMGANISPDRNRQLPNAFPALRNRFRNRLRNRRCNRLHSAIIYPQEGFLLRTRELPVQQSLGRGPDKGGADNEAIASPGFSYLVVNRQGHIK